MFDRGQRIHEGMLIQSEAMRQKHRAFDDEKA
jgi:hypothetical protein